MVALVLVGVIFLIVPSSEDALVHKHLQEAVDDIDRAIRFASNESVLKNSVVRLKINLDNQPNTFIVEYGPEGNLTLPRMQNVDDLSISEAKAYQEKQGKFESQFTPVEEFSEISRPLSVDVNIIGMATNYYDRIIQSGEVSLFFYPSGEKDEAIILFITHKMSEDWKTFSLT